MAPFPAWISCSVIPGIYSPLRIDCACGACGDRWTHDCEHPGREGVWFARYAALHAHNAQLQQYWTMEYHQRLQRFNMALRAQGRV